MDKKETVVIEATTEQNGRRVLSCAAAFRVSRSHDMTVKEIGEICNKQGIKITACQLGCFK